MRRHSGSPDLLQAVNATPMLDVMLVLLVIFMVVTPLIHSGPDLVLPSAVNGDPVPEDHGMVVRLSSTGELRSRSRVLSITDLVNLVKAHPDLTLVVEADRRLPYHRVEELLASVSEAGLRQASLVALTRLSPRRSSGQSGR